ncbi:MAG: hypothetical protein ACFB03_18240 [Paracoccaceae bacterium]
MRFAVVALACICTSACVESDRTQPDTAIGPVPSAALTTPSAAAGNTGIVLRKDDLECLRDEVEKSLADAPAKAEVIFNGLRICGIRTDQKS